MAYYFVWITTWLLDKILKKISSCFLYYKVNKIFILNDLIKWGIVTCECKICFNNRYQKNRKIDTYILKHFYCISCPQSVVQCMNSNHSYHQLYRKDNFWCSASMLTIHNIGDTAIYLHCLHIYTSCLYKIFLIFATRFK